MTPGRAIRGVVGVETCMRIETVLLSFQIVGLKILALLARNVALLFTVRQAGDGQDHHGGKYD